MEVRCQSANWQLCCGKDLLLTAENPLEINLKGLEWDGAEFASISCMLFPSSVYSCGCVCVWAWVRNAWPCWEEWLLYSCLVGTMGARAVSLGSCMDDLRRSPSFIKRTPTCRIDLAKKRGGNSTSSVFPDHKSLGGAPPPTPEEGVTPLSVLRSHRTREGAGPEPSHIWGLRNGLKNAKKIGAYRNNPGMLIVFTKKHQRKLKDFGLKCS